MDTKRMLDNFFDLVRIPSESPNDQEFINFLKDFFTKEFGANSKLDSYGNLIAKIPAKNSNSKEYLGLSCHADTVKPGVGIEPYLDGDVVKSKGETILAADDKGGIAEIIEAIRSSAKHPPIEIIITRCEEIGALGSKNLDFSMVESKMAYVLDGEEPKYAYIGGPSMYTLDVEYIGKPAHAGMEPEKGISAIQAAAYAINKLPLGRLDNESTANVGVINGGLIRNGIPEKCSFLAETRSKNHEKCMKNVEIMKNILKEAAEKFGAKINIKEDLSMKAYEISKNSKVYQLADAAFKAQDVNLEGIVITGGTDATFLNAKGVETVVLGVGNRKIHSCDEYLIVKEMESVSTALVNIMENLA